MKVFKNNVPWEDLNIGDVFRYTSSDYEDNIYTGMKVAYELDFPKEPIKEYILDLEDGHLYDDVENYNYVLANFSLVENYEG